MFRVELTCDGLTPAEGQAAPVDIDDEFTHRAWHTRAKSYWDGTRLHLVVENDCDATGEASLDEFWDAVHARINYSGTISLQIASVVPIA
jgi:hypothetical protein